MFRTGTLKVNDFIVREHVILKQKKRNSAPPPLNQHFTLSFNLTDPAVQPEDLQYRW